MPDALASETEIYEAAGFGKRRLNGEGLRLDNLVRGGESAARGVGDEAVKIDAGATETRPACVRTARPGGAPPINNV
ncbi:hypothetical protein EVAR_52059_1 [Eumeta japonica]|uniref:Uncharacterized protein n=1 Tax=Eumeta variegata TaxID=151549 RepID=A0A4C1Z5W7_EUMVA|nr:hypothetical protein EVAR_52059_1 [Eumeta japonica]